MIKGLSLDCQESAAPVNNELTVAQSATHVIIVSVEDTDANQDALRQVEKATDSAPVGEDEELLESPELQRQWREAKEQLERDRLSKQSQP